jgi:hypothetical protein
MSRAIRMKAISLAFHKSGTSSLHAWFENAGFKSLHYPKHVAGVNYVERIRPVIADNTKIIDALSPVITAFDAHTDAPWPGLYLELAQSFPQARFIMIERDAEEWWESLARDWQLDWVGRYLATFEWVQYRRTLALAPSTLITRKHRSLFIDAYRRHLREVKENLPTPQLCWLRLSDRNNGDRLSEFFCLPEAVPFPHRLPVSNAKP